MRGSLPIAVSTSAFSISAAALSKIIPRISRV
jgi:hypothetical protein